MVAHAGKWRWLMTDRRKIEESAVEMWTIGNCDSGELYQERT